MSHTEVMGEAERDKRIENRLNAAVRHCRIGKVAWKPKQLPKLSELLKMKPVYPSWPFSNMPMVATMDKCGCKVGSPCYNAACPHRVVVTC